MRRLLRTPRALTGLFGRVVAAGTSTRPVTTAVLAVLVATTSLLGGTALALRAGHPSPTKDPAAAGGTPTRADVEEAAQPALPVALPGAARRAPVAAPDAYPGALTERSPATLAAHQRAASIVDGAAGCKVEWTLLAAIDRVESGEAARAPLDGREGTTPVNDTDGGVLDGDTRWDAPVGPLALLPASWAEVAVDADDDGVRDPRDIDDAALAAAVLLCSGHDLTTEAGLDTALLDYHRADAFPATVKAVAARYASQVPTLATAPVTVPLAELPTLPDLPELCGCGKARAKLAPKTGATPAPAQPPLAAAPAAPAPQSPASGGDAASSSAPATSDSATPTPSPSDSPSTCATPSGPPTPDPSPTPQPDPGPSTCPTPGPSDPTPTPTPSSAPADPTPAS